MADDKRVDDALEGLKVRATSYGNVLKSFLTVLLDGKLTAVSAEDVGEAALQKNPVEGSDKESEEFEESAVSGIEEEAGDIPSDVEEFIDHYGNLIRTKKIIPSAVVNERTDAAAAAITDPGRMSKAKLFWEAKFERIVSVRPSRTCYSTLLTIIRRKTAPARKTSPPRRWTGRKPKKEPEGAGTGRWRGLRTCRRS